MTFTTLEELFEPIVMFFRLTNLPVTFQTMIKKNLWDFINIGEVASFIDNMIVEIEKKKEHNKVIKEIVRRLAENNLYIKLEKYKWKIREVGFLKVVIELEGIKMEKEKIKKILE